MMFLLLDSQLSSKKTQTKKKKKILVFFPTPKHRNRNEVLEKMLIGWMKNKWINRKNTTQKKLNSDLVLHLFDGFPPLNTQKNKINLNL